MLNSNKFKLADKEEGQIQFLVGISGSTETRTHWLIGSEITFPSVTQKKCIQSYKGYDIYDILLYKKFYDSLVIKEYQVP